MSQPFDLTPKKLPKQARSRATFDAVVDACALVLPQQGYAGTTTNHIAEAAGRPATAGFGGRAQDLAQFFGVEYIPSLMLDTLLD